MSAPYDRPASEPGGMECEECGVIFVGAEWHAYCAVCAEKPRRLGLYERYVRRFGPVTGAKT